MNPHFIFNSLIAIQSYIYKQDAVQAGDYLAKFADLIRITLENSRVEYVPLEKELKMLNAYLELQALRFENKFQYNLNVDNKLSVSQLQIPPMLAQPFIENAIEHGIRHKVDKGLIEISLKKTEECMLWRVEDDGIGRVNARKVNKNKVHQSMATSITRERLEILSKRNKGKFDFQIIDKYDDTGSAKGTLVILQMPFRFVEEY